MTKKGIIKNDARVAPEKADILTALRHLIKSGTTTGG